MRIIYVLVATFLNIHFIEASQNYVSVGCYKDKINDRALPDLIANYRVRSLVDWNDLSKTISNCARVAQAQGYVYFGVQFWGECWASKNGSLTYDKHGPARASACYEGVGKGFTNFVYRNTGFENECQEYTGLASRDRAMGYKTQKHGNKCDGNMKEAWYRFHGDAGDAMASTCAEKNTCDTLVQGWFQGPLPQAENGIQPGKVCFSYLGNCCPWQQDAFVRNCGPFYVYKLKKPKYGCPFRYCGNGK